MIPKDTIINVNGQPHQQIEGADLQKGDKVIDTKDWTFGVIDCIFPDGSIAVRDIYVVEIGIKKERLRKLIPLDI